MSTYGPLTRSSEHFEPLPATIWDAPSLKSIQNGSQPAISIHHLDLTTAKQSQNDGLVEYLYKRGQSDDSNTVYVTQTITSTTVSTSYPDICPTSMSPFLSYTRDLF